MSYPIKILKRELREWKQQYAGEKYYYKGEENHKWAKKSFRECKKRIAELENAIEVLKISCKVHVIKSVGDLDGKTIPVKFKVSKLKPKIYLDD